MTLRPLDWIILIGGSCLTPLMAAFFLTVPMSGRAEAGETICGKASHYGQESGSRTATGEYFDGSSMTMAMPSRKHLGETWRVTYRGKSVVLRVNDYGPAAYLHRIADLSTAAARKIGMIEVGVGQVCMTRL